MAGISEEVYVLEPPPFLGEGFFGQTLRMRNTNDNAVYAVKVISVKKAENEGLKIKDLKREAKLLQPLKHPNVVRYYTSYFSEQNKFFNVVMELVSGGSLAAKVKDVSVDVDCIRRWLGQMASVLSYLHYEMNIQHRDVKPDNILLTFPGNSIKLIDLGLACMMQSTASRVSTIGTATYSSYEKASSIPYDGRDDVWGAGCVFAELLVKARLSERGGAIHMFHNKTVNARRLLLIGDCVKVDVGLGSVIGRMLEPEQEHRCTSEELVRLLTNVVPSTSPVGVSSPSKSVVHSPPMVERHHLEILPSLVAAQSLEVLLTETEFVVSSVNSAEALHQEQHQSDSTTIISQTSSPAVVVCSQWSEKNSWGTGEIVNVVKFSPDGSIIAVAPRNSNILIYDPSGRLITTMKESDKKVLCLSFSPDGTKLAASCYDNKCVKLFEVSSGCLLWSTTVNENFHICFFNSSTLVASEGSSDSCVIIDASSGSITRKISACGIRGLCVSNRGTLITSGWAQMTIWDNLNSTKRTFYYSSGVSTICINSDGSLIYVGTSSGDILVYSDSGLVIREVKKAHDDYIYSLCMNETNSVLASGGKDNKVKLWSASTLECIQTLEDHTSNVWSVSFSPNNNLVSGSEDKTVKVWSCC